MHTQSTFRDPDFVKKEFVIVEFPEEEAENSIPMAIISSTWIYEKNGNLFCYWPVYLKSPTKREKAVTGHDDILKGKCTSCLIRIKFCSANYENTVRKLKLLEEEEESQLEMSDVDTTRKLKSNKQDIYNYSDVSDDGISIPKPPKLSALKSVISIPPKVVAPKSINTNKTLNTYVPPVDNDIRIRSNTEFQDSRACNACINNEGLIKEIIVGIENLKSDIKYLIQIAQNKDEEFVGDYSIKSLGELEELAIFTISLLVVKLYTKHTIQFYK